MIKFEKCYRSNSLLINIHKTFFLNLIIKFVFQVVNNRIFNKIFFILYKILRILI